MDQFEKLHNLTKNLTLLYVEDNDESREMTKLILEEFFDTIITATDGKDGLEKFQNNTIDLIISDINMPHMNGLEMSRAIREIDENIPIILLTAFNEDSYFLEGIQIGINGYVLKPLDLEQLLSTINRVVQKYKFQKELKEKQHLLETYEQATNAISIVSKTDTKGIITFVNDAFCKTSGYTREELIGKNHNIVRHPDNPKELFAEIWHTIEDLKKPWRGIVRNRRKDGKSYYVDSLIMPILDLEGNILEYISIRHDITEIMNPTKQFQMALENADDPLLIYMKLDKYEMLEEFYDSKMLHLIEEESAKHLQKRFLEIFTFDKIYNLGHGEFAILVNKSPECSMSKMAKTLKTAQEFIAYDTIPIEAIEFDISVIMSVVYEGEKRLESAKLGIKHLLKTNKNFIIANNLAKIEQTRAKENMQVVSMIKSAIENSRIVSYFQPIVSNKTKEIVKYESLVRLIDENGKVLSPYFFLETSKKSNYYTKITNIVLDHSFNILKHSKANVSINLSALDIEQKSTRDTIYKLLFQYHRFASRVVFELLEDEDIKDFKVIKDFITHVKSYGVKIAIDDFGSGYSNYNRLLDYQPDILKIDGSLIRDIDTNSYSQSVVKSIVTFAKEQNLETIAEFIENEAIFSKVKELGIDYSQGYYFGKPLPLEQLL